MQYTIRVTRTGSHAGRSFLSRADSVALPRQGDEMKLVHPDAPEDEDALVVGTVTAVEFEQDGVLTGSLGLIAHLSVCVYIREHSDG